MFTYDVDDELGHLINPSLDLSARRAGRRRGLPVASRAWPSRPSGAYGVVATGFNMHGEPVTIEGTEQLARCIQHETDHLDGVLFIDRLDADSASWR